MIVFIITILPLGASAEDRECSHCWCVRPDNICEHHTSEDGTTGNEITMADQCSAYCYSRTTDGEHWRAIHCDDKWIDWNADPTDPCSGKTAATTAEGEETIVGSPMAPIEPVLQVPDFNVQFSEIQFGEQDGGQYVNIPWIAEYIAAIYQYLVGAATILAIVMIMYGGFRWITAAGDAGKIGEAKKTIVGAAVGLAIALGSYTILALINPDLVSFKSLRVQVVEREEYGVNVENGGFEQGQGIETEGTEGRHDWSYTGFDDIFKRYAGCAGLDYRVLKGIAKKESGLNPSVVNKYGFVGLFQTKSCHKSEPDCDLTDPESNTKAVIDRLARATKVIKSRCGNNLPARDFYALLYLSHNSGLGSLTGAKKDGKTATGALDRGGCAGGETLKNAMEQFWNEWNEIRGSDVNGVKRYNYSLKVADYILDHGVKNPFNTSHGETCALD